ncbi:hypothetical protein M3P05_13590 [Sansalvadorimonas sp. 2012CJ34-2]|uniref:Uncharacterized protein n=1 Tax=Parendozoicomonas callyspongiae TaxID=2942213 RepID=A0ABT0PKI0_9GAMM|nr:hypothetical protein [Sansalvadorimonas sp. 2012CJ34-2]MCL6270958.1 hypothetical protein [Sansalvadorimonas sp. 2012CJ34-2]
MPKAFWKTFFFFPLLLSTLMVQQLLASGSKSGDDDPTESPSGIWQYIDKPDQESTPLSPEVLLAELSTQAIAILLETPASRADIKKRVRSLERLGFRKLKKYYTITDQPSWVPTSDWNAIAYFWDQAGEYHSLQPTSFEDIFPQEVVEAGHEQRKTAVRKFGKLKAIMDHSYWFLRGGAPFQTPKDVEKKIKTKYTYKKVFAKDIISSISKMTTKNKKAFLDLWFQILRILWLDVSSFNYRNIDYISTPAIDWREYILLDSDDSEETAYNFDSSPPALNDIIQTTTLGAVVQKLGDKNRELFQSLSDQNDRIAELEEKIKSHERLHDDLKSQLHSKTEENRELKENHDSLKTEVSSLSTSLNEEKAANEHWKQEYNRQLTNLARTVTNLKKPIREPSKNQPTETPSPIISANSVIVNPPAFVTPPSSSHSHHHRGSRQQAHNSQPLLTQLMTAQPPAPQYIAAPVCFNPPALASARFQSQMMSNLTASCVVVQTDAGPRLIQLPPPGPFLQRCSMNN